MRNFVICIVAVFLSYSSSDVRAQSYDDSEEISTDTIDFEKLTLGWTDERFAQYRDSIWSSVYKPIEVMHASGDASRVIERTEGQRVASSDAIINNHVPNAVSIDTNKPVGEIPIHGGMSSSGARTYEIPIKTSEGMHGFTPQITLSYNSQSPNSIAGVGWSVGGLSCIMRGSKTLYYDGKTEEIKMDNTDAFYLDGMRLIKISTGNGVITYETELNNIMAKAYGTTDAIYYFEVFYPDGRKCIYGRTADTENRLEYPLMSNSDLHGNAINYVYTFHNNHYNIFHIDYNGGYQILFGYDDYRPDTIRAYRAGLDIAENRRLTHVTCKSGTHIQRQYSLEYSVQNHLSLLTKVDYTEENASLNPLRFYYGEDLALTSYSQANTTIFDNYYSISDPTQFIAIQGKFDYHNNDDGIIIYPNRDPYWREYRSTSQNYFQNLYDPTNHIFVYGGIGGATTATTSSLTLGEGFVDVVCADVEGAGYDQVIKINNRVVNGQDQVDFHVYRTNQSGILYKDYTRSFSFTSIFTDQGGHQSIHPKKFLAGDFNGDGRMEILAVASHHPLNNDNRATQCCLIDIHNNQILFQSTPFTYARVYWGTEQTNAETAEKKSNKLVAMDYDGDGKTDFCHIAPAKTEIYSFEPSANGLVLRKKAEYTGVTQMLIYFRRIMPCDFNGDGLCDLLVSPPTTNGTSWKIHLSKGNGQFVAKDFTGPSMASNAHAFVRDVNGDGLDDIISFNNNSFTTYLTYDNKVGNGILSTSYPTGNSLLIPIDILSHGNTTQLLSIKNNVATRYSFPRNDSKEAMMTGMANSHGVVEKNAYTLLNETDDLIGSQYPATFPYTTTRSFLPVCRRSETFLNGDMTKWKYQRYTDAICHLQGQGFRCFYKLQETRSDGVSVTRTFAPDKYGAMLKEETFLGDDILNREFTYTSTVQSDKRAVIALSQKTEENYLTGVSSTSSYTNNTYGHPLTESTNYSDGISKQISYSYSSNPTVGDGYYIGYLTNQTVTTTRNGYTSTDRTQIISHNKCQPLDKKTYKNNLLTLQQQMTYDTHGNLISETMRKYSSNNSLTTSYLYDAKGRLTQKTDPMGLVSQIAYNDLGRVATTTDIRGEETHYTYDSFGREISALLPDTTVRSTSRTWTSEGTNGLFAITQMQTNKPTTKTIYDALGREVRKSDLRFDSIYRNIDRLYNDKGLLFKVSRPKRGGNPSLWNVYNYDNHNRIASIVEASGRATTYSYDDLSITTTENGIATTRTYDSLGDLVEVTDPAGTISYNLDANGNPLSINAPGNVTTTFTYDTYGRKTSISDPSAGTISYTYGDDGNISQETDAMGNVTSYTYDSYGRLTEKICPEFTTDYTYDLYNELTSIESSNDTEKEFVRDGHGRISEEYESAEGKWLQKKYFYSQGKLDSIQYQANSGLQASEHYEYSNGRMTKGLLNGEVTIYQLDAENEQGLPVATQTGIYSHEHTYNTMGALTAQCVRRPAGLSTDDIIQNFSYNIDSQTGNMISRRDWRRNDAEFFYYDALNRLTVYDNDTTTYDLKGNILRQSNVGTFEYNTPQKTYAISDMSLNSSIASTSSLTLNYTSFRRPSSIYTGNLIRYLFIYDAEGNRKVMKERSGIAHLGQVPMASHIYLDNCYEVHPNIGITRKKEILYLFGDCYSAPAAIVKKAAGTYLYYILRDNLGSITHVLDENGNVQKELSYDAWGRQRDPLTHEVFTHNSQQSNILGRGFCSHEHLTSLNLINMNARMYDPAIGRFISPDPYVQVPDNSQNFNRYSYCLNNPLKYTDQSGELFIIDDWLWGGLRGLFGGRKFLPWANRNAKNAIKIWLGLFKLDTNKDFWGMTWEFLSRHTWQLPQTIAGFGYAFYSNAFYNVNYIDDFCGATVLASSGMGENKAMTLGNYIIGDPKFKASLYNDTFRHEYGHYLQSQSYGWAYLLCVGLPSLKSVRNNPDEHKFQPFEVDANIRAYNYFNQYFEDAPKWNTNKYPLTMEPGTTVENKWWHYIVGFHLPWIEIPLAAAVGIYSPRVSSLTE